MDRAKRTRTGGIHHAVRAAKIQPAGNATCGHIAEETGEGILLPRHVAIGNALHHILGGGVIHAGFLQGAPPDGVAQPRTQRNHQFQRTGDAQQHTGPLPVEGLLVVARVGQRLPGSDHAEQLCGVGGLDVLRRDAVFHRIETDGGNEAAALGVGAVRGLGVGVEKVVRLPVRAIGKRRDGVHAVLDVAPVGLKVVGLWKKTTDAYDGQWDLLTHRALCVLLVRRIPAADRPPVRADSPPLGGAGH